MRVAQPAKVYLIAGEEDFEYARRRALENRGELPTGCPRRAVHFDGLHDIAR